MTSEQEDNKSINDELFHLYTEYQLCKVKKNKPSLWNADDTEKNALISILTQCQQINGDTLRSVMNDIFENSVAKYTDNTSAMIEYHQAPQHTDSSSSRTPQVIMNSTKDNDDGTDPEASREAATSSIHTKTHHISSGGVKNKFDNAAVSKRNILPPSIPRRGGPSAGIPRSRREIKKEKQKHDETAAEDEDMSGALPKNNYKEMVQMIHQVERSKVMLRQRVYTINGSFIINLSSTVKGTFSVLHYGSCPGTSEKNMYRCQENLIAYRFGKLVEKLNKEHAETEAYAKAKRYYQELQSELKRQHRTYHSFPWCVFHSYTKRVVEYVNQFGIYCLFIPEVISPTTFKRAAFNDLIMLLRYVDKSCFVFRDIVQLDHQGLIIAPHQEAAPEGRAMYKKAFGNGALRH